MGLAPRLRLRVCAPAAVLAAALAFACPAAADTFCVGTATCTGTTESTLSDAVAGAGLTGPDTIVLGPGAIPGGSSVVYTGTGPLEIGGQGAGATGVGYGGSVVTPLVTLNGANVTIHDLTLVLPNGSTGQAALALAGGAAAERIVVAGPGAASPTGVTMAGGSLSNALIRLPGAANAVFATGPGNTVRNLTLIGDGTSGSVGVKTLDASLAISDSVMRGFDHPFSASDLGEVGAGITPSGIAHESGKTNTDPDSEIGAYTPVTGDPHFAAANDFRPRFDSALVDAGSSTAAGAGETDLGGAARVVGGARDIGAYEYQRLAPSLTAATASPNPVAVGKLVTFSAAATDPDPAEPLTLRWSFDGGAPVGGATVKRSFATAGSHAAKVTVTDATGHSVSRTLTVHVATPGPVLRQGVCINLFSGTSATDHLKASRFGDAVLGGDGNDLIEGLQGDDCLLGDAGDDHLLGGTGDDDVRGMLGNDTAEGGSGNDSVTGGAGKDVVYGGAGKDRASGGPGRDRVSGDRGNDQLSGGAGNDRLGGGAGRDAFDAGAGKDTIDSRDGVKEKVRCGPGRDNVRADRRDRLFGCERVKRR